MHDGALVLQLALAVAAVWPGGILKSGTARCLAAPAARLAVTVLQHIGMHSAAARMRLGIVHDIAAFGAQLVLAAGRQLQDSCSSSSSASASTSTTSFLALAMLVLHGQLTAAGDAYLPAATRAQREEEIGQQPWTHELIEGLFAEEREQYREALQLFIRSYVPPGTCVVTCWERAPCWQQHSSAEDVRLVLLVLPPLLVLQPLLQAWECRPMFDACTAELRQSPSSSEQQELHGFWLMVWCMPAVLLQLAISALQRGEAALCTAALHAAAAAASCVVRAQQERTPGNRSGVARVLLLQWLQLVQQVLPERSSSSSSSIASSVSERSSSSSSAVSRISMQRTGVGVSAAGGAGTCHPAGL
ncbi:hypothetical protein COO60DRAFT_603016 [Scenedesmus sp. NREL 46B-D3]|nr:hypothetical protein COO60DRAFT_603016 [Scenedesmus sp. NREL 46B-D3]